MTRLQTPAQHHSLILQYGTQFPGSRVVDGRDNEIGHWAAPSKHHSYGDIRSSCHLYVVNRQGWGCGQTPSYSQSPTVLLSLYMYATVTSYIIILSPIPPHL